MSKLSWIKPLKQVIQNLQASKQSPLRLAVLGIGNELNGDDAAGVLIARKLRAAISGDQPQFYIVEAGVGAENFTAPLRRFQPDLILLIDAANLGAEPGVSAWVAWDQVQGYGASTHTFPPTMLVKYLQADLNCVIGLIGIQPACVEFDAPISDPVLTAVDEISTVLVGVFQNE